MRSIWIAFILLVSSSSHPAAQAAPANDFALRVAAAADSAAQRIDWPGFTPRSIPFALYDGAHTWLFGHPESLPEFTPLKEGVARFDGRHPAVTANSSTDIGGVVTATVLMRAQPGDTPRQWAGVVLHEKYHVYQKAHHPGWSANEVTLFTYPVEDTVQLALRRLESRVLRNAVLAGDDAQARCWAAAALELRTNRFARLDSADIAYERLGELNEGLPEYIQHSVTGSVPEDVMPAAGFAPAALRDRVYASGLAFALLLDRLSPAWKNQLEADDVQALDRILSETVGSTTGCDVSADVRHAEAQRAATDIAALRERRTAELRMLEEGTGWRVVVESAAPLWPQGFDPLNVEVLAPGAVVHRRYVKLGNEAGSMEVLDATALTRAAGDHPLFNGVRRATVLLSAAPSIDVSGDMTTIRTPGLEATFRNASITRNDRTFTVTIAPMANDKRPTTHD